MDAFNANVSQLLMRQVFAEKLTSSAWTVVNIFLDLYVNYEFREAAINREVQIYILFQHCFRSTLFTLLAGISVLLITLEIACYFLTI